jgi:F-type H+-transporting ATPase subunit c
MHGGSGRKHMQRFGKPLVAALGAILLASPAFAETAAEGGGGLWYRGLIALAAGLGLGLAAFGAALGQGRATAAAMESIGRNPNSADRIFTPLIVGLALMEALALYALVIAFFLQGKV